MGQARYPHRLDKLAVSLLSAVNAKEQCVKQYGIGEDLPMSVFCWKEDRLELVLSLAQTPETRDHTERFKRVSEALCIVKKGWGVDAFTMVSEGWVSTNPEATSGRELGEVYVEKDSPVSECLAITHVENDEVTFIAKPYKQLWGRKIEWEDELYFPGKTLVRGQNAMYPNLFARVLDEVAYEEPPEDEDTYYASLSDGLSKKGFACEWM
jgi:hypothetical protein